MVKKFNTLVFIRFQLEHKQACPVGAYESPQHSFQLKKPSPAATIRLFYWENYQTDHHSK